MDQIVDQIANALGIPPAALPVILIVIYLICKATARLIPDNATGWRAVVRNVAAVISVDLSSRIAPGITIAATAKAAASTTPVAEKLAEQISDPSTKSAADVVAKLKE